VGGAVGRGESVECAGWWGQMMGSGRMRAEMRGIMDGEGKVRVDGE
jgi:hypothetical protein